MKETFKHVCPKCKAKDKVVIKCPRCWKYTCVECSINKLCMDCWVENNKQSEVNKYVDYKRKATV